MAAKADAHHMELTGLGWLAFILAFVAVKVWRALVLKPRVLRAAGEVLGAGAAAQTAAWRRDGRYARSLEQLRSLSPSLTTLLDARLVRRNCRVELLIEEDGAEYTLLVHAWRVTRTGYFTVMAAEGSDGRHSYSTFADCERYLPAAAAPEAARAFGA